MPGLEELLERGTVAAISGAVAVLLLLISMKLRRDTHIRGDFTLLIWAFMAGWLGAEVLEILSPPSLELLSEGVHFAIILIFAIFLAFRWSWAMGRAVQGAEE